MGDKSPCYVQIAEADMRLRQSEFIKSSGVSSKVTGQNSLFVPPLQLRNTARGNTKREL